MILALLLCLSAHADTYLSARATLLSAHLFDVARDAHNYPWRLDRQGRFVVDPGIALSADLSLHNPYVPYTRLSTSVFRDCAAQPQGYQGLYAMFPRVDVGRFAFFGGMGGALALRRSWARYVEEQHSSRFYRSQGSIEWSAGLFGEVELGWELREGTDLVLNVVPGIPYLLFTSVGLRGHLGPR